MERAQPVHWSCSELAIESSTMGPWRWSKLWLLMSLVGPSVGPAVGKCRQPENDMPALCLACRRYSIKICCVKE